MSKKPAPLCPMGHEMELIQVAAGGWRYVCVHCATSFKTRKSTSCGWLSPIKSTKERAYEAATCHALQKPMSLEAVLEKSMHIDDNVIWLEQPDEDGDTCVVPALVSNYSRYDVHGIQNVKFLVWPKDEEIFPVVGQTDYGRSWRCWANRPTDEERGAAAWEA